MVDKVESEEESWVKGRGDTKEVVCRMEGGKVEGQRETTPKPAISIGHLGVRVGSRGGSEGGIPSPPRGANVWQFKSTPSRFHLPLYYRRQPPSSSEAPRRGKNFLGVG